MKKNVIVHLVLLAAIWAASAAAIEVPLTYEEYPAEPEQGAFLPYGNSRPQVSLTRPEGEWKLPRFKSGQPLYIQVQLGDETRLGVLDRVDAEDPIYRRLYLDLNGNRDLTDDRPIDADRESEQAYANAGLRRAMFPATSTQVSEGGAMVPYRFRALLYDFSGQAQSGRDRITEDDLRSFNFRLYAQCCYRGQLEADGKTYDVWLSDGDADGLFDEPAAYRPPEEPGESTDRLVASGTHLYAVSGRAPTYYDSIPLGGVLVLRDKTFKVDLDIPGKKLLLEPVTEGLSTAELAMPPSGLLLCPTGEGPSVTLIDPGDQADLPEGSYRLMAYRVFGEGKKKDRWALNATGTFGSPVVTVGAEGARFGFGEPFVPSVEARMPEIIGLPEGQRPPRMNASLRFVAEGAMKERVTDLRHLEGTASVAMATGRGDENRPKEPTFRIATKEGEVVHSGAFEYG